LANTLTPEEAAKVRELESQLDFLKVRKNPDPVIENKADNAATLAAPGAAANGVNDAKAPSSDAQGNGAENNTRKPGEMSALDRARASRFAPPRHIMQAAEKAAEYKSNDAAPKAEEEKDAVQKTQTSNQRNAAAPAITPPREVAKPQTMVASAPRPVPPNPVGPQPALKLAMTVEEAKKQGLIAPGTYGKPDNNEAALKGDTKEIPNLSNIEIINDSGQKANEAEKEKAHPSEPIKNPLPVPKKHVAKDMDYDLEVPPADMHFDVVDMSGKDFFDVN